MPYWNARLPGYRRKSGDFVPDRTVAIKPLRT